MTISNRLAAVAAFVMLAAGCASAPTESSNNHSSRIDPATGVDNFYDGAPEVLFATEFPVNSAEDALQRGDRAHASGETDLALYMYVRAYDLENDNRHALQRIAQIHESRDNLRLATRAYRAMLKADPRDVAALESLGLIYLKAKAFADAKDLFERAVLEDSTRWRAFNGLGVIADMRGEHGVAVLAYDSALAAKPGDPVLLNNRGYSYYLVGAFQSATRDFIEAGTYGLERAWVNLGLVMARQGRYPEAVQTMLGPIDAAVAYNDVGYIAMRQGDYDVAELYFEKAISLSPRHFAAATQNLEELKTLTASRTALALRETGVPLR